MNKFFLLNICAFLSVVFLLGIQNSKAGESQSDQCPSVQSNGYYGNCVYSDGTPMDLVARPKTYLLSRSRYIDNPNVTNPVVTAFFRVSAVLSNGIQPDYNDALPRGGDDFGGNHTITEEAKYQDGHEKMVSTFTCVGGSAIFKQVSYLNNVSNGLFQEIFKVNKDGKLEVDTFFSGSSQNSRSKFFCEKTGDWN